MENISVICIGSIISQIDVLSKDTSEIGNKKLHQILQATQCFLLIKTKLSVHAFIFHLGI